MVDDVEAGLGTVGLGDCDSPAELDDRRLGEPGQLTVEGRDLGPVVGLVDVERCDGSLNDVGPPSQQRQSPVQLGSPPGDPLGVPQRAVLVGKQHQLSFPEAGGTPLRAAV